MKAKNILAVVLGLIASFIIILLLEGVGHVIYPPPTDLDMEDIDAIKAFTASAPNIVFILAIVAYAIGSIIGGLVSAVIAINNKMSQAITVGGILMGLGAYNLFMIPHPIWTIIISIFVFIPCSYLGGWWGIKVSTKKKPQA